MSRNHQEHTYGKRVRTLRRLLWVLSEVRIAVAITDDPLGSAPAHPAVCPALEREGVAI